MAAHLMIHLTEAAAPGVGTPAKPGYAGTYLGGGVSVRAHWQGAGSEVRG